VAAAVVAQDLSNEREMTRALRDQVRSARERCSASGSTRRPGLSYGADGHGDGESALAAVDTSCRSATERNAARRRSATRRRSFRRTARVYTARLSAAARGRPQSRARVRSRMQRAVAIDQLLRRGLSCCGLCCAQLVNAEVRASSVISQSSGAQVHCDAMLPAA